MTLPAQWGRGSGLPDLGPKQGPPRLGPLPPREDARTPGSTGTGTGLESSWFTLPEPLSGTGTFWPQPWGRTETSAPGEDGHLTRKPSSTRTSSCGPAEAGALTQNQQTPARCGSGFPPRPTEVARALSERSTRHSTGHIKP